MSTEKLIGTWVAIGFPSFAYNFISADEGFYSMADAKKEFKYKADDTRVVIYYPCDVAALNFKYEIIGDVLSIKDSFGNFVKYRKM